MYSARKRRNLALVATFAAACALLGRAAVAAESGFSMTEPTSGTGPALEKSPAGLSGTWIEAVERNVNPSPNVIGLGMGVYPFDPFYMSLEASVDFTHHFNEEFAWEIFDAAYEFPFAKDLTTLLETGYGVNPSSLPHLQYVASSDAVVVLAYGKSLFGSESLRYFRVSLLGGVGVVDTTANLSPAVDSGLRAEFYVGHSRRAAVRFDFRNLVTVANGSSIYPRFLLGIGFGL